MFNKGKSPLASLFGQLAEAQKGIDDSARKLVEGLTRMIDVVDDEAPSSRSALGGRDFTWYDNVAGALAGNGFTAPMAFESRDAMSRPVESRTIAEYALGEEGTIVASWFAIAGSEKRPERRMVDLFTLLEDGASFDTAACGVTTQLPAMDTEHEERLPEDTPVQVLLARHRARIAAHGGTPRRFASVDEYMTNRRERAEQVASYRRGLGLSLIERFFEARFTGDKAEIGREYIAAIRKHPEWYKYAKGSSGAATSSASGGDTPRRDAGSADRGGAAAPAAPAAKMPFAGMPLNFLMSSTDDDRHTLTTFGMLFAGVPELIMTGVAANHCRAARVLAGTVAAGITRARTSADNEAAFMEKLVSPGGARITLTVADAIAARVTQADRERSRGPFDVHLFLRGFTPEDEPSMLHVDPLPDDSRSFDERVREACARLGVDVPPARGSDSADDAMREAHERAVARLGDVRARWKASVGSDQKVLVKMRAAQGESGEYIWLEVRDWRDGVLEGVAVTPAPRVGVARGQSFTIQESQVYDQLMVGPAGADPAVPALTDVVATDYGMDA